VGPSWDHQSLCREGGPTVPLRADVSGREIFKKKNFKNLDIF
jgi:hypothetical protein